MIRVIAEIGHGQNDINYVLDAVEAAAEIGIWAVKGQLLRAETIATPDAVSYGKRGAPHFQVEDFANPLPYDQWAEVALACRRNGMQFFASPWDLEALRILADIGCSWVKIGSGDMLYREMLETAFGLFPNMLVSTGGATLEEIQWLLRQADYFPGENFVPMACTLTYPAPIEEAGLHKLHELRSYGKIRWPLGYSDHTESINTGALAVAAGAEYLEKHFTIRPDPGGPGDHGFALDPIDMALYVEAAEEASYAVGPTGFIDPGFYPMLYSEHAARRGARRSLWATENIEAGEKLNGKAAWLRPSPPEADLRPSIAFDYRAATATRSIPAGTLILLEMIDTPVML